MNDKQVPALPMQVAFKGKNLIIEYGKYQCKFKPLDKHGHYSGLLVTKFLWQVTKELWEAYYSKEQTKADVKSQFLGIDDNHVDEIVARIHNDLFGDQ